MKKLAILAMLAFLAACGTDFAFNADDGTESFLNRPGVLVPVVEPVHYVWAWRREEDLSFIDPQHVKVAVWTATIHVDPDGFAVERRTNSISYPNETEVVGVVRLEVSGVPDDDFVPGLADAIIGASRPFRPVEYQVDFDARLSQRAFYRRLLGALRARTDGARLSIAALASWCFHDDWTRGLPVDFVVPMLYRMGRDGDLIRRALHAERQFPNPVCAGQVGYSADESLAPVNHLHRVFLFHPEPWSKDRYTEFVQRVRTCNATNQGCS